MRRFLRVVAVVAALTMSSVAAAEMAVAPASQGEMAGLKPLYRSDRARAQGAAAAARESILREAGLAAGAQGGYAERAREISALLARRATELDRIFSFTGLTYEGGRLLAPVVEFVEEVQAVEADGSALRETARVLRVTQPARLVTVAPTWRDWLFMETPEVERPDDAVLPTTGDEREVWAAAVADGWSMGRLQADRVYETRLEILTTTYEGMLRYRDLVAQGVVAPAEVGRSDLGIVREDAELRIGDNLYTLKSVARFQEPKQWRAVPVAPRVGEGQQ